MDNYIRRTGHPAGEGFYDALSWLYPDDPWVKRAAANFAAHRPTSAPTPLSHDVILQRQKDKLASLETLLATGKLTDVDVKKSLHSYLNPFDFAASLHYLLQHQQRAEARELANRFHAMVQYQLSRVLRAWATRLVQMTAS
jgi:hypothetical protein